MVLWWFGPNEGEEKYIYLSLKSFISTKSNRVKKCGFLYLYVPYIISKVSTALTEVCSDKDKLNLNFPQDSRITF